jgi:hypothetical protein
MLGLAGLADGRAKDASTSVFDGGMGAVTGVLTGVGGPVVVATPCLRTGISAAPKRPCGGVTSAGVFLFIGGRPRVFPPDPGPLVLQAEETAFAPYRLDPAFDLEGVIADCGSPVSPQNPFRVDGVIAE